MPMAPPPLFKKMGSAAFLGVILSNWATPWAEQTCGGECMQRSGSWCSPRVIHTDTMRHWLELNVGLQWTRHALMRPRRPPPLPSFKQASSYADTYLHTLCIPSANHAKLHFIHVISPHTPPLLLPLFGWSEKSSKDRKRERRRRRKSHQITVKVSWPDLVDQSVLSHWKILMKNHKTFSLCKWKHLNHH